MLSQYKSSLILDEDTTLGSFGLKVNNSSYAMYINGTQNVGIGTSTLTNKLSLKCTTGDGINIVDSVSNGYGNILVGTNGSLHLSSSNNLISADSNFNIGTYDGATNGLFIASQLVKASAQELNYVHAVTIGLASASKALVVDSSINIAGINSLLATNLTGVLQTPSQPNVTSVSSTLNIGTTSIVTVAGTTTFTAAGSLPAFIFDAGQLSTSMPILATSGGTGFDSYNKGDILVATGISTLTKVALPISNNYILQADDTSTSGVSWGMSNLTYYQYLDPPKYLTNTTYTFGRYISMDSSYQYNIKIISSKSIDLSTTGVNGIDISANPKTGTIYPDPNTTTLLGNGTLFTSELTPTSTISITQIGSMGSVTETKKVTNIATDTSLTIDTPFTLLNRWVLGATGTITTTTGLYKFGTGAFNGTNATTANVTMTIGSPNLNFAGTLASWTLEFFVRISALSAQTICASNTANTFKLDMSAAGALTLFIGQGSTFNIANGTTITGHLTATTYFHLAIVFDGSTYVVYKDGINSRTVTSALKLSASAFNVFIFGGSATKFNGQIDEIRLSSVARYSTTFTPPATAFVVDSSTICLNHFDIIASATASDVTNNYVSYVKGGGLSANTVFYGYAINSINSTISGYIFSSDASTPELPAGYTLYSQLPYFIPVDSTITPYPTFYNSNNYICFGTPIPIVTHATNVTPTIQSTSLVGFISTKATSIDLLITHTHVGNVSCGVTVGYSSLTLLQTVLSISGSGVQQLQITIPLASTTIDTYLSAKASTTSYDISIVGVQL